MAIITVPLPIQLINGQIADAGQVMTDMNAIASNVNANAAKNGVNSDITSLTALVSIASGLTITGATIFSSSFTSGSIVGSTIDSTSTGVTQAPGTNTTQLATTAFVAAAAFSGILPALAAPTGASLIGNQPAGNISATTVQGALNELDTEKVSYTDAAASSGSSLVGFIASGTGAVAETEQTKLRQWVSVDDFGAVGDGTTDDTTAFQNALNSVTSGIVRMGSKVYKIASNLNIPINVGLFGPLRNTGEQNNKIYDTVPGTILLVGTATINLASCASIEGLQIINFALKGLLPFATAGAAIAAVAAYSGTAITQTGSDGKVTDCLIIGFSQAFSTASHERTKLDFVSIDCTNGVLIDNSTDIARINRVHCWPYLTTHQGYTNNASLRRTGSAFKATTHMDTGKFTDCFSYGWDIGFDIQARETISIIDCYADSGSFSVGQIGFKFTSVADQVNVIGGGSSGVDQGAYVNVTSTSTSGIISLNNVQFWGNHNHITSDQHRSLSIFGCHFRDTNAAPNTGITLTGTVTGITNINGNIFDSLATPYSLASGIPTNNASVTNNRFFSIADTVGTLAVSDNGTRNSQFFCYNATGDGPSYFGAGINGSVASPSATQNGANLLGWTGQAWDGSQFLNSAQMRFTLRQAASAGNAPGGIVFQTLPVSSTSPVDRLTINEAGNVFPVADNAYSCGVNGQRWSAVWAANGTIQTSDIRTKTEIKDATLGLNFINSLRPVSYKFIVGENKVVGATENGTPIVEKIRGKRVHWGLISQEVKESIDAEGVDFAGWVLADINDENSQQSLRYDQFISPLIKAVQELSARVQALEGMK